MCPVPVFLPRSIALVVITVAAVDARAQSRIEGLATQPAEPLLIFTVRGQGVGTPLVAFQERARAEVEAHMHVRVLSMDEMLARGGAEFQNALADCRGEPKCLSRLVGKVDAKYLLMITATVLGDTRIVGSRLIDLANLTVIGEAVDEVAADSNVLETVPVRIKASIPAQLWDPFGSLTINVSEPGAQISVNGRPVGLSPISALGYLTPGDYKVDAIKEGFKPAQAMARIERLKPTQIALKLEEVEGESSSWIIWVGLGALVIAGGAIAGAVVFGRDPGDPMFCSATSPDLCP
jgi:hypothetical protein